jgi:hypothetical protein
MDDFSIVNTLVGMSPEKARRIFNKVIEQARAEGDLERVARTELLREYFTNPDFHNLFGDMVWDILNPPIQH